MAVRFNEGTGCWDVQCSCVGNDGRRIRKHRRGFRTVDEARAFEECFRQKHENPAQLNTKYFVEQYFEDVSASLKVSTLKTKRGIFDRHILPAFGSMKIGDIRAVDILRWQNGLVEQGYSQTYLRSVRNQLAALFSHARRYYRLANTPLSSVPSIGAKQADEIAIWSKDEYKRFADVIMDKPKSFMAFEVLYWCGLRRGELLALTLEDICFDAGEISINKSLQRIDGEDVVSPPKTRHSMRRVLAPAFLMEELRDYVISERILPGARLFDFTPSLLAHEMRRGCKLSGVKRIRIHDLRHSHVSLLVGLGFDVVSISKRIGHSKEQTTLRYAHMFKGRQGEIAESLDRLRGDSND